MSGVTDKPFWIDESAEKQEAYFYGEQDAHVVSLEHRGHPIRLLVPRYAPPTDVKVTASEGDLLFLLGVQLDEEGYGGEIIGGGYGVVMVARRHPDRSDTYCVFVWHALFEETFSRAGVLGIE